jgi:ACS family pantothenate transporter-like MFS transporter
MAWHVMRMKLTSTSSFHCIVTQPLNYFSVWLKSLDRFSVYQLNLFPTAAQALGLVTTLAYGWISDGLGGKRWQVLIVPAVINFIGMVIVASYPDYGATFFGYLINAASWGYWPVLYVRPIPATISTLLSLPCYVSPLSVSFSISISNFL